MAWKLTGRPYLWIHKITDYYYGYFNYNLVVYLSTDSTNTRRAFTWIRAQKASLKFTFSQRTRGPCNGIRFRIPFPRVIL